jgi:tRNA-2-methylthio-N6-dimethylallyladenosine synthase
MNRSDSERIASVLESKGYQPALKIQWADLIVVNMCSVRQSAVDRVFGKIKEFAKIKEQNPKLRIILTGCILKKDRKKLKERFDFASDIGDLPEMLPSYENNFSAFIPISNGCNNFCAYCVVPFTRGHLVCRDYKEIVNEVKGAILKGAREIWFLGQNVNDYQSPADASINFAKLLKLVNGITGNFWLRFTSPNPADFSDELIETMAKCKKITPYLNLPIQSGDDEILRKMKRAYTAEEYKNLINKIRAAFKNYRRGLERYATFSTDVIVGFPGETRKHFENTSKLFKEIKYDMAYIAKYSQRPGTSAEKMKDNVSLKEKERRWKILTAILKKTALKRNKKFAGKTIAVLVEKQKNGFFFGKSRHYKTVKIKTDCRKSDLIGKIIRAKISDALTWGLKGKIQKN